MRLLKSLLVLFCIEGLAALIWTFFSRSESGHALFLWLSLQRIALLLLVLILWLAALAATILLWRSPTGLERLEGKLDEWCEVRGQLGAVLLLLLVPPVLVLAAFITVASIPLRYPAYESWAPNTFPLMHALVEALLPLVTLILVIAIELGLYLVIRYRGLILRPTTWSRERIGSTPLWIIIGLLVVFHWSVLAFQLRFFKNNPAWYWAIKWWPFSARDVLFVLAVVPLLALAYWLLIVRRQALLGLLCAFLLGWFLQVGVGVMAGGGFASLAERYFSTYHKAYVFDASHNHASIVENVRDYEKLYGSRDFTNTKPPGLIAFYIGLDALVNGSPSAYPDDVRYARLSAAVTYAFPVIAMLMVFLIYAFARRLIQSESGLIPFMAPLLFIFCPNVILLSLFPDQAIYPLAFLLGVGLIIFVVRRGSLLGAFLLGMLLYLAVFFAFSLLPLFPFAGLYLALHYWTNRQNLHLRRQIAVAAGIAAGTLLLYLLFMLLLNYNFLPRFERMVSINHNFDFYLRVDKKLPTGPEPFSTRLGQVAGAVWLNNLDFAAALGFPIYILFIVQAIRLLKRLFQGLANQGDIVLSALLLSFLVLNLGGTAQGEVPRLWLFWVPLVVLLMALELERHVRERPWLLFGLLLIQFITIVLTYHFQDLRM